MKTLIAGCLAALWAFHAADAKEPEQKKPAESSFTVHSIGTVEKQGRKSTIVIKPEFADALLGLDRNTHVWVMWWFHENDTPDNRAILQVHPRGNLDNPLTGVFACRSPYRPNLIALTLCKIVSLDGNRLEVETIDAFPDTPVIDLKPYVPAIDTAKEAATPTFLPRQ